MTPQDTLYNLLVIEAKNRGGGPLKKEVWLAIVATFLQKLKPVRKKAVSAMTDEEWLVSLETDPVLAGVDVRQQLGIAQFWLKGKPKRKFTRPFFRNWLIGAIERGEVKIDGAGQSSKRKVVPDIYVEPEGWQVVAAKLYPGTDIATRAWKDLGTDYRRKILEAML